MGPEHYLGSSPPHLLSRQGYYIPASSVAADLGVPSYPFPVPVPPQRGFLCSLCKPHCMPTCDLSGEQKYTNPKPSPAENPAVVSTCSQNSPDSCKRPQDPVRPAPWLRLWRFPAAFHSGSDPFALPCPWTFAYVPPSACKAHSSPHSPRIFRWWFRYLLL